MKSVSDLGRDDARNRTKPQPGSGCGGGGREAWTLGAAVLCARGVPRAAALVGLRQVRALRACNASHQEWRGAHRVPTVALAVERDGLRAVAQVRAPAVHRLLQGARRAQRAPLPLGGRAAGRCGGRLGGQSRARPVLARSGARHPGDGGDADSRTHGQGRQVPPLRRQRGHRRRAHRRGQGARDASLRSPALCAPARPRARDTACACPAS